MSFETEMSAGQVEFSGVLGSTWKYGTAGVLYSAGFTAIQGDARDGNELDDVGLAPTYDFILVCKKSDFTDNGVAAPVGGTKVKNNSTGVEFRVVAAITSEGDPGVTLLCKDLSE